MRTYRLLLVVIAVNCQSARGQNQLLNIQKKGIYRKRFLITMHFWVGTREPTKRFLREKSLYVYLTLSGFKKALQCLMKQNYFGLTHSISKNFLTLTLHCV